ncbi:MAG: CoA-binding protein [Candidatus Cloacimonetes bacterium]|nr:CoA-binding protein [Candidatus Cloacimonadota bacterium]
MNKLSTIQAFLAPKELAVCGVSRDKKKFGRVVYDTLKEKGFKLYGINPNMNEIDGEPCYQDVLQLPGHIQNLYIVTQGKQTEEAVKKAIDKGIRNIWIQQMAESPAAIELAEKNDINLIKKECILKFAEPVTGVHKFHRFLSKLFGMYPKN